MKEFFRTAGCVSVAVLAPICCLVFVVIVFFEGLRESLASNPITMPLSIAVGNWMNAPYTGEYLVDFTTVLTNSGQIPIGVPIATGQCGFIEPKGYIEPAQAASCRHPVPEDGAIISGTRYAENTGSYCIHYGVDFNNRSCASKGCPISAVMGGRIAFDGWSPIGFGHLIIIENQGWQFYYAHLQCGAGPSDHLCGAGWQPEFQEGELIFTGQQIGLMGNSSWVVPRNGVPHSTSTGAHLHFEIHFCENGKCAPANPELITPPNFTSPCASWAN